MKNSPILIIGKNGKTGVRVNQRLQALVMQLERYPGPQPRSSTGRIAQPGAARLLALVLPMSHINRTSRYLTLKRT